MKYKAISIYGVVFEIELTDQDLKDLQSEYVSFLDFDCHNIFLEEDEWLSFKAQVNQF